MRDAFLFYIIGFLLGAWTMRIFLLRKLREQIPELAQSIMIELKKEGLLR